MTKRIGWADALRGLLILLIVYGHTATNGDGLKHYVYSFHVAAFFFLSGYLFSKSGRSAVGFIKRKFLLYMVPYYAFASVSILIFTFLGAFASAELDVLIKYNEVYKSILGMLYASGVQGYMKWNLPLWFLPCMFVTQVMFYFIDESVSRRMMKRRINGVFMVIASLVLPFLDYFVFRIRALPFHLESSVFLMPFFLAGACLRRSGMDIERFSFKKIIPAAFLLLSGALIALFFNCRVNYFLSSYGKLPVFYLSAFLSVSAIALLAPHIKSRLLSYVGKNTMPILLMHKFPVVFFQIVLSKLLHLPGIFETLLALVLTLISAALCLLAGRAIEAFAPILIGKSKTAHNS